MNKNVFFFCFHFFSRFGCWNISLCSPSCLIMRWFFVVFFSSFPFQTTSMCSWLKIPRPEMAYTHERTVVLVETPESEKCKESTHRIYETEWYKEKATEKKKKVFLFVLFIYTLFVWLDLNEMLYDWRYACVFVRNYSCCSVAHKHVHIHIVWCVWDVNKCSNTLQAGKKEEKSKNQNEKKTLITTTELLNRYRKRNRDRERETHRIIHIWMK